MRQFLFFAAVLGLSGADLILHNGRVVTVDAKFTIAEAVAVTGERITAVGTSREILAAHRTAKTQVIDLGGKMVVPGLIDAHVHALDAALSEARGPLPDLSSIAAIQNYIRAQARAKPKGRWIVVPRTLPPRLKEMRMPTRHDLDVAPEHLVAFDGSYVWSANTLALKHSGINRTTPSPPGGEIVKDEKGEPNGILRNAAHLLKDVEKAAPFTETEKLQALEKMLRLYAEAGLTTVGDRAVTPAEAALFERLKKENRLGTRVVLTWRIGTARPVEAITKEIRASNWTTNQGDEWLKLGSFKVTLDGGQSVGTAYQRMPYGPFGRQLYGQTDPRARGMLFVDLEKLTAIYSAARDKGWQLTAHVQGGAAIDTLLDAFERLDKMRPLKPTRSHLLHGSFMSDESLNRMQRMGILADVQPGWLHFDVPALQKVFGLDKMRYFYPLRSYLTRGILLAGGSDHMIGHDADKAVNPFNPFLNMWMSITRRTTAGQVIYPEERITREEALKMHTVWPAYVQFSESEKGTIETGKLADLVVIDRDYLRCPEEEISKIRVVHTVIGGQARKQGRSQ